MMVNLTLLTITSQVDFSLNGQDFSRTVNSFTFHAIANVNPFGRPARCTLPQCVKVLPGGASISCDFCDENSAGCS